MARAFKQSLAGVVEAAWAAAFRAAGRISRPHIAGWSSPGDRRVLVLAPHPDDEAVGCAGTILCHRESGDEVRVVCVTDGRASRALGLGPDEMARRRRQEAEAAAGIFGLAGLDWLGLPEGAWQAAELCSRLQPILRDFAPHLIYAPSRVDFHFEHFQTAHALAAALSGPPVVSDLAIRVYQIQAPLTPALTNLVAGLDGVLPRATQALQAYATQWDSVARSLRMRRYAAGYYGPARAAEEFWELGPAQYLQLHSRPPQHWPASPFRSLRPRPWSDPLAYLSGRDERRRLAAAVGS